MKLVLMMQIICVTVLSFFSPLLFAKENILNIYTWSEEIPMFIIHQFEKETGIKVNSSTFDSNEMMYAKLRASPSGTYDVIEPSSYYIDRMWHQDMLVKLDKKLLPNFKNIDPIFLNRNYDPKSDYSIPFTFGITGVFLNKDYFSTNSIKTWNDLLDKRFLNQLILLDDSREVFSMALKMLGYSINDSNPDHIKQAYYKLKTFMPNVKLFNNDAVISILIDEDATVGMVWNGNLFKAIRENNKLIFIYPNNGFEIWVDNFAILKNAPHEANAYKFLNFLMRPDIAAAVSLQINYSSTNLAARKLMPPDIRNNPILYPSHRILQRGEFESDIGDKTYALFEAYWEQLKMSG